MYTEIVSHLKNITLTADAAAIERARQQARAQRTTLNEAFREWLARYSGGTPTVEAFDQMMKRLQHVSAGRKFTRDEMNERGRNPRT